MWTSLLRRCKNKEEMKMEAKDMLVMALDLPGKTSEDIEKIMTLLTSLKGKVGIIKVNSLASAVPGIIQGIKSLGFKVWRDWKHYDIPGTVGNFIDADIDAGVDMVTVHTLGGFKMLELAVARKKVKESSLNILGITILTSYDEETFNKEVGISGEIQETVRRLALLAENAGLDGVVASPKEARMLRGILKPETLIITPGITPIFAIKNSDQAREATPFQAIIDGANYIVVGSAIYKAENPVEAVDRIVVEIEEGLREKTRQKLALDLFNVGAIKFGAFKLKLHETNPDAPLSPIYIDLRLIRSFPGLLADVVDSIIGKVMNDGVKFDLLSDIPTALTPFVTLMSQKLDIPMISPKISKTHGLEGKIDGLFLPNQSVLLVDDLITKADSKIEAANVLEKNDLVVRDIAVLIDRQQGGKEALIQSGYRLHSVFNIMEMLHIYLDVGKITQERYNETVEYLRNN